MYQMHLWQIINAIIAQKLKLTASENSRLELAKRLVSNMFFSFNMQYKRVYESKTSQMSKNQDKERSGLAIKEMNQGLDVSINGISDYLCICLSSQYFGREP